MKVGFSLLALTALSQNIAASLQHTGYDNCSNVSVSVGGFDEEWVLKAYAAKLCLVLLTGFVGSSANDASWAEILVEIGADRDRV